jgi:hypothetical protein
MLMALVNVRNAINSGELRLCRRAVSNLRV